MAEEKQECNDQNCPEHGHLKLRGREFIGKVVSDKMDKTVTVEWSYSKRIEKYERYARDSTKISAHNPPCINAKAGDKVKVKECRPISKTKRFVVQEIIENKD